MENEADGHRLGPEGIPERIGLGLAEAALVVMMVLTTAAVVMRSLFQSSLDFTEEMASYLLVALFFFSIAACHTNGAFHQVELIQGRLPKRAQIASRVVFDLLALAACLILLWFLVRFWRISWQRGEVSNTLVRTPLWIPRTVLPIGTAALCYAQCKSVVRGVRALRRPAEDGA